MIAIGFRLIQSGCGNKQVHPFAAERPEKIVQAADVVHLSLVFPVSSDE
jgi:hypothetical protein